MKMYQGFSIDHDAKRVYVLIQAHADTIRRASRAADNLNYTMVYIGGGL
jgi:hypothetical protein